MGRSDYAICEQEESGRQGRSYAFGKGRRMQDMNSLRDENERLKRAIEELSILNELASTIGSLKNCDDVVRKIMSRSIRAVDSEQAVITLLEEPPSQPTRTLVRTTVSSSEHGKFHLNQSILGWMILNKKPLTVNDPRGDQRFQGVLWDNDIRNILSVPMLIHSVLKGILTLYNKRSDGGFTWDDQRLIAIIAAQSAQIVENARLCEEERALFQIQHEMKLASQIQADLLPKGVPCPAGYDISGATLPARFVGGDYYDIIPIDDGRTAICLGDVSGKGLPASLLAANLQAAIRGETSAGVSVRDCVCRMNRRLYRSTGPEKFATLFYGILDSVRHRLTYCNAGQEPPFIVAQRRVSLRLAEGGSLIGITDELNFEEAVVPLNAGDVLVIYSDGITEAMNCNREQFGEANLLNIVARHAELTAERLIDKIVDAVREHAGGAQQHDDITMLVVKRNG